MIRNGETRRTWRKTCCSVTLSITNLTWTGLKMNPVLRSKIRRITARAVVQYFGLLRQLLSSRQFIYCSFYYTLLLGVPTPEYYLPRTLYKMHLKLK